MQSKFSLRIYDFTAKTFWAKVQTGRNVNREKEYLVESQFIIKLKLRLKCQEN